MKYYISIITFVCILSSLFFLKHRLKYTGGATQKDVQKQLRLLFSDQYTTEQIELASELGNVDVAVEKLLLMGELDAQKYRFHQYKDLIAHSDDIEDIKKFIIQDDNIQGVEEQKESDILDTDYFVHDRTKSGLVRQKRAFCGIATLMNTFDGIEFIYDPYSTEKEITGNKLNIYGFVLEEYSNELDTISQEDYYNYYSARDSEKKDAYHRQLQEGTGIIDYFVNDENGDMHGYFSSNVIVRMLLYLCTKKGYHIFQLSTPIIGEEAETKKNNFYTDLKKAVQNPSFYACVIQYEKGFQEPHFIVCKLKDNEDEIKMVKYDSLLQSIQSAKINELLTKSKKSILKPMDYWIVMKNT